MNKYCPTCNCVMELCEDGWGKYWRCNGCGWQEDVTEPTRQEALEAENTRLRALVAELEAKINHICPFNFKNG